MEQIATFMGKSLTDDVIDKIKAATTFKAMKSNPVCDLDAEFKGHIKNNNTFFRKGL